MSVRRSGWSDEQRAIAEAIDELCLRELTPEYLARCHRESRYPAEAMAALASAGWAALAVPDAFGGTSGSAADLCLVHECIARHSLAVAQAYYSLWVLGAEAIQRLGNDRQRLEWLPRLAAGEAKIAFALTEPGSGSDAAALRTRAELEGEHYVVNGQKVFVTGAAVADRIVTAVRTTTTGRKQEGITMLLLDPALPGVTIRPLSKLGLKALDLCEVFFDDVRVPRDDVLGRVDEGWADLTPGLAKERLLLAAISVGALWDVLEKTTEYAREREAFGRPIAGYQMVAERIVRMRVAGEASRGLVRIAAELVDAGDAGAAVAASIAKLHATEAYVSATRDGLQVFGGYGFTDDYPVSRHYADAKYLEIGGGTSQIQTIVIARSMELPV